jgi:hypothetical protein
MTVSESRPRTFAAVARTHSCAIDEIRNSRPGRFDFDARSANDTCDRSLPRMSIAARRRSSHATIVMPEKSLLWLKMADF